MACKLLLLGYRLGKQTKQALFRKNMKFYSKLAQFLTIFMMGTALCLISNIKAEATVSFVKSEDSATQVVQNLGKNTSSITKESQKSRSHAPEPTTMALVGGSLVSMIIRKYNKNIRRLLIVLCGR